MLKLNVSETMQAQSYAAYMMAASYFVSSVCTTPQMEKRTYLLYRMAGERTQQNSDNQFMEGKCLIIRNMQKRATP